MRDTKRGAALLASILLLGLMLVLTLLYTAMVRLEGLAADWHQAEQRARLGLETALAWALADTGETYDGRVYALPGQEDDWVSLGEGGPAEGLADEFTAQELGWPWRYRGEGPGTLLDRAARATWETHGDTSTWHLATAWVGVDLTGLLDTDLFPVYPAFLNYQFDPDANPFLTPGEFTARHPAAVQLFLPNNHALDRGWYDNGTWKTEVEVQGRSISPDLAAWDEDDIRAVFAGLYPDANLDELTSAFQDFLAGRDAPTAVDSLTAVPIPMFNEVAADLTITNHADVIRVEVQVQIEIWFPNLGTRPEARFRVSESPAILPQSIGMSPQQTLEEWEFDTPAPFTVLSMNFVREAAPLLPGQSLDIAIPLDTLEIERIADARVLDRMAPGRTLAFSDLRVPAAGETLTETRVLEALDPKLNHRPDIWIPRETATLGALNASALEFIAAHPRRGPLATFFPRQDAFAWDPSGPQRAPEELGFFPLDQPWATLNLFGEDGRWFLRHLRNPREPFGWVGGVNPNSSYHQVLEAAFQTVRVERFPGDPGGTPLSEEQSWTLAEFLQREVGQGNGFVQRGDWTRALEEVDFQAEFGWDRFQAESLVRQLNGVFQTSQQYWGLVLMAEWRSPEGLARGRARAAALIRRDPFADAQGRHSWARQLWIPLP